MSHLVTGAALLVLLHSISLGQVAEHWDLSLGGLHSKAVEALPDGHSLVVGQTSHLGAGGRNLFMRRYDVQGILQWELVYNGPQNQHEYFTDLAVDANGRAYLCGYNSGLGNIQLVLLAVDATGSLLWVANHPLQTPHYFRPRIAVDAASNVTVNGDLDGESWIGRYAADGTLLWEDTLNVFAGTQSGATDIAVASNGTSFLAGHAWDWPLEFFLAAYDVNGTHLWTRIETGPIGSMFPPAHAGADEFGNGFLVGSSQSTCGVYEFRAVKFRPDGTTAWNTVYPGASCNNTTLVDMAVAPGGDLVLAGYGPDNPGTTSIDFITMRLDGRNGSVSWIRRFAGPGNHVDLLYDLDLDTEGRAYVTGNTEELSSTRDITTVAYDVDGTLLWSATRGDDLIAPAVGVGASGDVVVATDGLFVRYHAEIGEGSCAANANSTGFPAAMTAYGSESLYVGDLRLVASPVPDSMGMFFHGPSPNQVPFGNGFLCVTGGIIRLGPPALASQGQAMYDVDTGGLPVGMALFQYWYRDMAGGGALFNTSDALSVAFD